MNWMLRNLITLLPICMLTTGALQHSWSAPISTTSCTLTTDDLEYLNAWYQRGVTAIRLTEPVSVVDDAGNIMGILNAGCVVSKGGIEDYGDTDLSMGHRLKLVFDIPEGATSITKAVEGETYYQSRFISVPDVSQNDYTTTSTAFTSADEDALCRHFKSKSSYKLTQAMIVKDDAGAIVAQLNSGCVLRSPGLDDYDYKTPNAATRRMKIVFNHPPHFENIRDNHAPKISYESEVYQ